MQQSTPIYEHQQPGSRVAVLCACIAAPIGLAGLFLHDAAIEIPAFIILALGIAFMSLTTRVDERGVSWTLHWCRFPAGRVDWREVRSVEVVSGIRAPLGVHLTQYGWLWTVAGREGVMIRKRTGDPITLGTDDPQGLYQAIERFRVGA